MGLGAAVMCNCYQDGKTTSPPFPREWIEVDEEGYLTLTEDHASSANVAKLCVWEQSCCDHQDMDYVSESIANWSWYRLFQAALGEIGLDSFIVLSAKLPNTNDGTMQPPSCRQALLELDYFMSWGVIGKKTVLVDSSTDESLYEYVPSYGGIFIWSKDHGINVGLNTSHFFAVDSRTGAVVFCARRFRQFNKDGSRIAEAQLCGRIWRPMCVTTPGLRFQENRYLGTMEAGKVPMGDFGMSIPWSCTSSNDCAWSMISTKLFRRCE